MKTILVVEDDSDIAYSIRFNFENEKGWEVRSAASGQDALRILEACAVDLVLLDLNLPDIDGLSLFDRIRRHPNGARAPVIMLTARISERDRVRGLDVGADDYVTKPFSMAELVARVRAHLRRESRNAEAAEEPFKAGGLGIDPGQRSVSFRGKDIRLTKTEFDLLWLLVSSRPRVVSRRTILEKLWSDDDDVDERIVDVHVHALRRKIAGKSIETVVGVGYRFRTEPAESV